MEICAISHQACISLLERDVLRSDSLLELLCRIRSQLQLKTTLTTLTSISGDGRTAMNRWDHP